MTDEQQSAARLADRGDDWLLAHDLDDDCEGDTEGTGAVLLQALHDRDRYHRDAQYWREECIKLTGEALA